MKMIISIGLVVALAVIVVTFAASFVLDRDGDE